MEKARKKSASRGFTLVEIMIAIAITGIVMGSLIIVFSDQQKSYATQSELARTTAEARASLQFISRDVRMAGYTGIPMGLEGDTSSTLISPSVMPIISSKSGGDLINGNAALDNARNLASAIGSSYSTGDSDIVEIWGNFRRATTTLANPASPTASQLVVVDGTLFQGTGLNRPGWVAIGKSGGAGFVTEVIPINGTVTTNTINLNGSVSTNYEANALKTFVAPLYRRVFYLDLNRDVAGQIQPALIIRNCFDYTCTSSGSFDDEILSTGVTDFQVNYDSDGPNPGEIVLDQDLFCDPCAVRNATITITTAVDKFREGFKPITRQFTTSVDIRNIGLGDEKHCTLIGCSPLP